MRHLRSRAFDALAVGGHTVDVQGWINAGFDRALAHVTAHLRATWPGAVARGDLTFVEVGSWKGASTTRIADHLKPHGLRDLIAVDTWLGAPEFYTWGLHDPTRGGSLACVDGYPTVFYTFTKNVKSLGHHDVIAPFPVSSCQGAAVLRHYGIRAHALYLDASHERRAVLQDLATWRPVVRDCGVMWGDDYCEAWPGVKAAVDEYAATHNLPLTVLGTQWILGCSPLQTRLKGGHRAPGLVKE